MVFIAAFEDFFKSCFHVPSEQKGVKGLQVGGEAVFGILGDMWGVDESLVGGFGAVVMLDGL
jgi:hypothetical protein